MRSKPYFGQRGGNFVFIGKKEILNYSLVKVDLEKIINSFYIH